MTSPDRRVVIVSADQLYADALRSLLEGDGWAAVVAIDGVAALSLVTADATSSIIIVGDPPRIGAAALVRRVRSRRPDAVIVAIPVEGSEATPAPIGITHGELTAALEGQGSSGFDGPPKPSRQVAVTALSTLTPREREILLLLASGVEQRDIADRTKTSPNTVRTHVQHLYAKLNVHSMLELVRFVAENGLVQPDGPGIEPRG